MLLKDIVWIDEGQERKERSTRASGLEDTFGGKINVGEEYVGQNKYRFPGRLQKGAIQYIICQSWWKNQRLNLLATHCLISIVSPVLKEKHTFYNDLVNQD